MTARNHPSTPSVKSSTGVLIPLYFLSGTAALIYEIVWARMLGLAVGTAVTAWAAILVAYMGGMAAGSFFGGRLADRARHPLRLFALLEAGIGLYGIFSSPIIYGTQNLFARLSLPQELQTAVAVLTLILPTMLMGATFPVISRAFITDARSMRRGIGLVYSANTCGAITGAIAVGFFLLPSVGMSKSILIAAIINFFVAAAAFTFRRTDHQEISTRADQVPDNAGNPAPGWLFPTVLVCSGFCAMAFEVLWSRSLVFFLTSTTYSFTVVLSVVLAGLAAGSTVATASIKKGRSPARLIAVLQYFIGAFVLCSLFFLHSVNGIINFNEAHVTSVWWHWIGVRYAACFMLIFPAACCMGATFPLALSAACGSVSSAGRKIGGLLALNTAGGIAGSLLGAFVLIPLIGIQRSFIMVAGVSCVAGVLVFLLATKARITGMAGGLLTLALFIAAFFLSGNRPLVSLTDAFRGGTTPPSIISYREDRSATVAVLETARDRRLNIDGFNAAGTRKYEYMHLLGHLPVLLSPSPDTVLVICFGSGTTCGVAALHPRVNRVDCAEISSAVIATAPYFADVNYHATENPKVRMIASDGRNLLLRSKRSYDVITLEPMLPFMASATNLYSADFYRLCRSRLSAHGVMTQWAPMHVLSLREYRMLVGTFLSVFPHASLWVLGSEAILVGSNDALRIDPDVLRLRMSPDAPMADLRKIAMHDPERLLSCFIMDEKKLLEFVGDAPVITDDRRSLEFSVPHHRVLPLSKAWILNMSALLENRVSVLPSITPPLSDSMAAAIDRGKTASSLLMDAAILKAQGRVSGAHDKADAALQLMPGDAIGQMIKSESGLVLMDGYVRRARFAQSQGDQRGAENAYLDAIAVDSSYAPLLSELAEFYIGTGNFDNVIAYAQKAVTAAPYDPSMHTNLAVVFLNLNRPIDAEKELLEAIRLNAEFGRAWYFLAQLYQKSGRTDEAEKAYQRVQALGYRE